MAEVGEYSERYEWVAGVFFDKAEAERLLLEHAEQARRDHQAYSTWWRQYVAEAAHRKLTNIPLEAQAEIKAKIGLEPKPEADRFYIITAPINVWGQWTTHEGDIP